MSGSSCSHSTAAQGQSTSLKRNSLCWGRHGFAQLAYGTLKLCCCCSRSPVLLQKQIVWQGNSKGRRFIISDLLVSFSPCSEVLVQPWLKDFIHSFLSSYFPFPHCQHCQQLWGQACPCRHGFARSSAFSLTLPPSAVLRVRAKTNALFPLVTLRANYPVKQWFTRNVWSRWYKSLLSAKNPYLVTQKPFISCWYQFLYSNFRRNLTEFLQAGSRFAICCAVAAITNVKQPRQQWVVPLFLPAHCEKESKDGFCHRRLIKDAVALHNVNYLYSVQNFLLCSCFIQL